MASCVVGSASLLQASLARAVVGPWCVHCDRYCSVSVRQRTCPIFFSLLVSYMTLSYYFRSEQAEHLSLPSVAIPTAWLRASDLSHPSSRPNTKNPLMRTALAVLSLASAARALSAYHSQRMHSKEAAAYRAQASALRKEAAILETELIKERKSH